MRILHLRAQQLGAWERAGLIPGKTEYGFGDLVQLRKLRELKATRLSAANIRASVHAMRAISGMANPLLEAGASRQGQRLVFRHSGAVMEPIARQFVFDFAHSQDESSHCVTTPAVEKNARDQQVQTWFVEGVRAEEAGRLDEAAALYQRILEQQAHAPASINLGTIFYNRRQFARAEQLYRAAAEADPGYALAFFDLGNALDELQRLPEAINAYLRAICISPRYADAHYNLALAYERTGERRKALRHWTAYVKLDPVGPWSNHARSQVRKILDREKLAIVHRRMSVA